MIQIGQAEDDEKPQFAPMPVGKKLDTVTLEEALEMFKLPRTLGKTSDDQEITTNLGRFGPYVKFGSTFVSIKGEDPFTITHEKALEFIAAKQKLDAEKLIQDFPKEKIQILNGRYGPYVTDGKTNAKVPKDVDPKQLTLEDAQQLIKERISGGTEKPKKARKKR